jgi:hypothetical protein
MPDPNLINSGLSQQISVEGHELRIEIVRLEHETQWSLEVVDEDGTSTVWDDLFDTDQSALDAAFEVIREEGLSAFRDSGNVFQFPKK